MVGLGPGVMLVVCAGSEWHMVVHLRQFPLEVGVHLEGAECNADDS